MRSFQESKIAFPKETFHYEGEVVLKVASDYKIGTSASLDMIESFALGIDLTRREKQSELKKGLPWTVSKSFLGSAIVGEFQPKESFKNPESISFQLLLNGILKQNGNLKDMIFPSSSYFKLSSALRLYGKGTSFSQELQKGSVVLRKVTPLK